MRFFSLLPAILLFVHPVSSQNLAIGQWKDHLPYCKALLVTGAPGRMYCGAENSIFSVDFSDRSLTTLSKVNGLSDIGLSCLRYDPGSDILFAGYENGNLDLVRENSVVNISDIKRKNIIGSKRINNVMFQDRYAYAACGFGIVKIDLEKNEIKETFFMSLGNNNNSVYGIAFDGINLYASSDSGIYATSLSNPGINFFATWSRIQTAQPNVKYDACAWFANRLFCIYKYGSGNSQLMYYENSAWYNSGIGIYDLSAIQAKGSYLVASGPFDVKVINNSLQQTAAINNPTSLNSIRDAVLDENNIIWLADNNKGLVEAAGSNSLRFYVPNSPRSGKVTTMKYSNGTLWVTHSGYKSNRWDPIYSGDGFSSYDASGWNTFDKTNVTSPLVKLDSVMDFMSVAVDPANNNHVFLGSRGKGVVEFENGQVKNYFSEPNSTIQTIPGFPGTYWMGGMVFDGSNNLWAVNSNVPFPLLKYTTAATWEKFNFSNFTTTGVLIGDLVPDSYGNLWVNILQNGLVVYNIQANTYRKLNDQEGSGNLSSLDVRAFAEDKSGQMWVGTTAGVCVFYSPQGDAQKILLLQDGNYQYLLETEVVTSIAIDGANRKWFGTENSGVYLMSADGTKQVLHFTAENSPLLSNKIYAVALDDKTGIVYFGTDRGLISYKSDATEGGETCNGTYVYPNPVRPEYEGPIAIAGLMQNGNVKITDISGTLVYETTALGGQAIWYGKNFKGEKVHTGVYLVFCSDADGKNTCITKLLFIN